VQGVNETVWKPGFRAALAPMTHAARRHEFGVGRQICCVGATNWLGPPAVGCRQRCLSHPDCTRRGGRIGILACPAAALGLHPSSRLKGMAVPATSSSHARRLARICVNPIQIPKPVETTRHSATARKNYLRRSVGNSIRSPSSSASARAPGAGAAPALLVCGSVETWWSPKAKTWSL
jgi:hypothetical protein